MANGRGVDFAAYEEACERQEMIEDQVFRWGELPEPSEDEIQEQEATARTRAAVGLTFEELQAAVYGVRRV